MDQIVQFATVRVNITADGFLGTLEKANVAASVLRGASIEPADAILCPAVKLIRNIRIIEENGLRVPDFITSHRPAKTFRHLPDELGLEIVHHAILNAREDITREDELWETDGGHLAAAGERRAIKAVFQGWHAFPYYPITAASVRPRLLYSLLSGLGQNRQLRRLILDEVFAYNRKDKTYVKELLRAFWFSFHGSWEEPEDHGYIMNANNFADIANRIKPIFEISHELYAQAMQHIAETMCLVLYFDPAGEDQSERFLAHSSLSTSFEDRRSVNQDTLGIESLIPHLHRIKQAIIVTSQQVSGTDQLPDDVERLSVEVEKFSQAALVKDLLPGLEDLSLIFDGRLLDVNGNSLGRPVLQAQALTKAIGTVRGLPLQRKSIIFFDDAFDAPLDHWEGASWEEAGARSNEQIGGVMTLTPGRGFVFDSEQ